MQNNESTLWGIHAGRTGEAEKLFLQKKYVALGWHEMGVDLSTLPATREAFRAKVAEAFPDAKPGAIPVFTGQLYRFVHELKPGDVVIYPSKKDRKIHIGRIEGPYKYDPTLEPEYPNLRPVKWLKAFPRTHFTQGALYEIGSAMSFFQVKKYADEFLAALEGKASPPPPSQDETVALVAEDI